jgi:pyridoxal phosphate enzyme (YggS family)
MIEDKIKNINLRVLSACKRSGVEPSGITLLAVTKTVSDEKIKEVLKCGITHIGESRVQEAVAKFQGLKLKGVTKHFIGRLQTNKAKKAVEIFDVIQSIDSYELAHEVNRHASCMGKVQECYLEIKVSPEETKFGLSPENAENFLNTAQGLKNIRITGIMAMAPYFNDPEQAAPFFRKARTVYDSFKNMGLKNLSMGMSGDFEIAIEEGATMVRIATAKFK